MPPSWHLQDIHGNVTSASFQKLTLTDARKLHGLGWEKEFDWTTYCRQSSISKAYKLVVPGKDYIHGAIAYHYEYGENGFVFIDLLENAPHNRSKNNSQIYINVPEVLIGEACLQSMQAGFDGWVFLVPKTRLFDYYSQKVNARREGFGMSISNIAAQRLKTLYYY